MCNYSFDTLLHDLLEELESIYWSWIQLEPYLLLEELVPDGEEGHREPGAEEQDEVAGQLEPGTQTRNTILDAVKNTGKIRANRPFGFYLVKV